MSNTQVLSRLKAIQDPVIAEMINHFIALLSPKMLSQGMVSKYIGEVGKILDLNDPYDDTLKTALIHLKLLQFFAKCTGKAETLYEETVFSVDLGHLIDEVRRSYESDYSQYGVVLQVLNKTSQMLEGSISPDKYEEFAYFQKGHPSVARQIIGGLMLCLAAAVAVAGALCLIGWAPALVFGGGLALYGLYKIKQGEAKSIAAPMLELVKNKTFDDQIIAEGYDTQLFPQGTGNNKSSA